MAVVVGHRAISRDDARSRGRETPPPTVYLPTFLARPLSALGRWDRRKARGAGRGWGMQEITKIFAGDLLPSYRAAHEPTAPA